MNLSNDTVMDTTETITAIATPPGKGGVAILRVSGPKVKQIASTILGLVPTPRYAHFGRFQYESDLIDEGLALFFLGPHSFTGEDVLELQAHGGPIVMQRLLKAVCSLGARIARPGEFTERAFLNGKIDLTQCEAIADLIDANSESAAKAALSSLQGVFSAKVNQLVESVVYLRMYVEAAIDFPEEEVDYLSDNKILNQLDGLLDQVKSVLKETKQGVKLRQGFKIALLGKPNVGKSSLLNSLAGDDVAIVTAIAGTTRDWVKEDIVIDGLTIQVTDTAGIRKTDDIVEQKGIERSYRAGEQADRVLLIVDGTLSPSAVMDEIREIQELVSVQVESDRHQISNITVVLNKMDLISAEEGVESYFGVCQQDGIDFVRISAQTGAGMEELRHYLKGLASGAGADGADSQYCAFTARARHVHALETAMTHLNSGREALVVSKAGELLAEELRLVQESLGEITGKFSTEDLLGRIFSSFCMGK